MKTIFKNSAFAVDVAKGTSKIRHEDKANYFFPQQLNFFFRRLKNDHLLSAQIYTVFPNIQNNFFLNR